MAAHALKASSRNLNVSYLTMCEHTVPRLRYLVDLSVGVTCFGVVCAYLVVIGDLMPDVTRQIIDNAEPSQLEKVLESRQFWIITFLCFIIIPTARLKRLDGLRFTSTAAIVCFAYVTTIIVLYAYIDELELCDEDDRERYEAYCDDTEIFAAPID